MCGETVTLWLAATDAAVVVVDESEPRRVRLPPAPFSAAFGAPVGVPDAPLPPDRIRLDLVPILVHEAVESERRGRQRNRGHAPPSSDRG